MHAYICMLTYTVCVSLTLRVLFGTPFLGMVIFSSRPILIVKLGGSLMLAVSYAWAYTMVAILLKRARKGRPANASGDANSTSAGVAKKSN